MTLVQQFALAIWGLLVGFVGWASCFRLIVPIADWLLPLRGEARIARGAIRLVVCLFLIFSNLLALALMPLVFVVQSASRPEEGLGWRNAAGIAFIGSFVGLVLFGVVRHVRGDR
jgi:hypothetical protein